MAAGRPKKRAKRPQEFTQHSQPWNYGVQVSKSDQPGSNLQSSSAPPLTKRPRFDVYQESLSSCGPNEVPSKLRPEKERPNKEKFFVGSREATCVNNITTCTSCNLKESEQAAFSEKCQGQTKRGPVTGNLNEMLALSCYKIKVGVTDLRFIISCLNILPPSSGYLYKKLNELSSTIISVNECVLVENQKFVQEVNMLTYKGIHVQTDTAYNHRPQSGGESATWSIAIVMEHTTSRKLPLCVSIANKLCSKKTCIHLNCKKNHRTEDLMSSTETKLAKENLNKLEMLNILKIDSLTCDASAQLEKTVREHSAKVQSSIRQYTCYVHT
ncbi:hypothetical protein CHS0354_038504 [Potamilus streckersoni]|uniref:Mutator-like transposase domain-containing protein n=1 Tax=Potamilus streckersoni TaxID=2493646 RepID=A0AAE0VR49_9BIVA|nr:hypothetical protein CHS0354_038504 [Potamilus streckersoni]